MTTIGLFAYGEMSEASMRSLLNEFIIKWIILPLPANQTAKEKITENLAKKHSITINYISDLDELFKFIQQDKPDLILISSFNKIIPPNILKLTNFINVHIGDLPRYRGRATVNWAIINDNKNIALTIHKVIPELDSGNIYKKFTITISIKDTVNTIYKKINSILTDNLSKIVKDVLNGAKGNRERGDATYCCTRIPEDGLIDWNKSSKYIYNFIRAQTKPYPGAFTYFKGKKMIIWEAEIPKISKKYEGRIPGRIVSINYNKGVEIMTGDSTITFNNINYENKNNTAVNIIKSTKHSLGVNLIEIYEFMNKYLKNK